MDSCALLNLSSCNRVGCAKVKSEGKLRYFRSCLLLSIKYIITLGELPSHGFKESPHGVTGVNITVSRYDPYTIQTTIQRKFG